MALWTIAEKTDRRTPDVKKQFDPYAANQEYPEQGKPRKALRTLYIVFTVLTVIAFIICILATFADLGLVLQGKKTFMEFLGDLWEGMT